MPPDEPGKTDPPAGDKKTDPPGGDPAPSVEEAAQLLKAFKDAGIDDPKGALATIQKLRGYEKGDVLPKTVSKELEQLRKQVKDAEDAKLSDTEKLQARIAELEEKDKANAEKASRLVRDAAIVTAARAAGAIDPDAMPALIDPAKLEMDAAGEPTNLKDVLAGLKKDKPVWFREGGPGSFDGGSRQSTEGEVDMEQALRAAAGH